MLRHLRLQNSTIIFKVLLGEIEPYSKTFKTFKITACGRLHLQVQPLLDLYYTGSNFQHLSRARGHSEVVLTELKRIWRGDRNYKTRLL